MTIEVAEFILASAGNFLDDSVTTRIIQSQFTQEDDKQEVQQWRLSGFDSSPSPGVKGLIVDLGSGYKISVAEKDGLTDSGLDPGERKIYSDLDGTIAATITLRNTGLTEIKNETLSLGFETAMTELIAEIKAIITTGSATTQTVSTASKALIETKLQQLLTVVGG